MKAGVEPILEVLDPGLGVSFQDLGRRGWKKFGVPPGGAMDEHAARWANVLLGNPANAPVLELLLNGARLGALSRVELSLTGAAAGAGAHWRTLILEAGGHLAIPPPAAGVWSYLGVRGGFAATRWFGSVSIFPRGGLGRALAGGDRLGRLVAADAATNLSPAIASRWVDPREQRDYRNPPPFRVWPGPQWDLFRETTRAAFFEGEWRVSSRSDRTGYRLDGPLLAAAAASIPSEPVLPGSIQLPPDGRPIITLRDGPTVGGYPKLGLVAPELLSWLSQCRPGQLVRFVPV
jgi:allophanate hydrolase